MTLPIEPDLQKLIEEAREFTKDVWPPNGTHLVDRLADALERAVGGAQGPVEDDPFCVPATPEFIADRALMWLKTSPAAWRSMASDMRYQGSPMDPDAPAEGDVNYDDGYAEALLWCAGALEKNFRDAKISELAAALKAEVAARERAEEANEVLRTVAGSAARVFRHYERLHFSKGTPDGDEKARVNANNAEKIEAALAHHKDQGGEDREA